GTAALSTELRGRGGSVERLRGGLGRAPAPQVEPGHLAAAGGARVPPVELGAALVQPARVRVLVRPAVAPPRKRQQDQAQLVAGLSQAVLVPRWMELVELLLHDALGLEAAEAARENVSRGARVPLDGVEPVHAERQLPDDEQRPLLADDCERGGDRAGAGNALCLVHVPSPLCQSGLTFP